MSKSGGFFARAYGRLALPVMVTDLDARIVYVNPAFTRVTGYGLDEIRGENPRLLQSGLTKRRVYREMWRALTAGEDWHGKLINRNKRGRHIIESLHVSPLANASGETAYYLGVWLDVTRDVATKERLRVAARTDDLTGLLNRRGLVEQLERELRRARRHGRPLCAMLVDLDDFKATNDRHGHATGDAVLRAAGAAIKASVRAEDVVGRYGGDEFVVLLPEAKSDLAHVIADRVVAAVRGCGDRVPAESGAGRPAVSCSAGVAAVESVEGVQLEQVVRTLDRRLFAAKSAGKGRVSSQDEDAASE